MDCKIVNAQGSCGTHSLTARSAADVVADRARATRRPGLATTCMRTHRAARRWLAVQGSGAFPQRDRLPGPRREADPLAGTPVGGAQACS